MQLKKAMYNKRLTLALLVAGITSAFSNSEGPEPVPQNTVAQIESGSHFFLIDKSNAESFYEATCLHGDSLRFFANGQTKEIEIESIKYLHFREKTPWWPYLLATGIVGASSYSYFRLTSKQDAWFTPKEKAAMGASMFGGLTLFLSIPLKEMMEHYPIVHKRRGIADAKRIRACK